MYIVTVLTIEQHSCCNEQDPTVYPKLCAFECLCVRAMGRWQSLDHHVIVE